MLSALSPKTYASEVRAALQQYVRSPAIDGLCWDHVRAVAGKLLLKCESGVKKDELQERVREHVTDLIDDETSSLMSRQKSEWIENLLLEFE